MTPMRDDELTLESLMPLHTEGDVAKLLGISVRRLQEWRLLGKGGPDYIKVGASVRYSTPAIIAYIESRTVHQQRQPVAGSKR